MGAATDNLLRKYENIIKASDVFNDVATLRQQLVILGTPRTVAEWRFYAYENDGFVLMLPSTRAARSLRPAAQALGGYHGHKAARAVVQQAQACGFQVFARQRPG